MKDQGFLLLCPETSNLSLHQDTYPADGDHPEAVPVQVNGVRKQEVIVGIGDDQFHYFALLNHHAMEALAEILRAPWTFTFDVTKPTLTQKSVNYLSAAALCSLRHVTKHVTDT